jgi:Helicase conserved C-terminal domain
MLDTVIAELIRKQRPYFLLQGNPIKGVDHQYWIVFKRPESLFRNIVTFIGLGNKNATYKLLRVDPKTAKIFEYTPCRPENVPSTTLLRTGSVKIVEKFLDLEKTTKEKALLAGSFREIQKRRRKYNLPDELDKYNQLIGQCLERTTIYRRSTAYFDSGVLKLYEEPLHHIVQTEGQIRLLMDWQGFTKKADLQQLEKLQNPEYLAEFASKTLTEFLQELSESAFSGTEILGELVRLGFLQIKLVKMSSGRAIYHKKTGILSDSLENHIFHEGSDNFTRAAHSRNAESVTFLYSWDSQLDAEVISESIQQFDREWDNTEYSFDLTQEFLQQVIQERDRRTQQHQPSIDSITPDEFPSGETTPVEIAGKNLDLIEAIEVSDDNLIDITIKTKESDRLTGTISIDRDRPPQPINTLKVKTPSGEYNITPQQPISVSSQTLKLPNWEEIPGFKAAIELILAGQHGTPNDFLYWLAQQRPSQFRVEHSSILDELQDRGILYEHQKSGAQHCLRVMEDFGVAVCADAVGLGKTRLAAAVACLYRQQNSSTKIAVIAAKKLLPNWERELEELGLIKHRDYEPYNKNLMSRKGNSFLDNFNRFGGADLILIDEAHEGIRNYNNRIHRTCLQIQESDRASERQRDYLLLTATPWNNRREDIYNILSPFLNRPEGFKKLGFPVQVTQWFENRDIGVENFTDDKTGLFRRTYRELFLQRTRQMLREATPELSLYAKRIAEWLPVEFEINTEKALEQIFTQFETSLYIPFADPIRYLKGNVEQRALLRNQRRFFLQRTESSMYALRRTIENFGDRIREMQQQLEKVTPDAEGLKAFLLLHYGFESEKDEEEFDWDDDDFEEEEEDENIENDRIQKRQQLNRSIELATEALEDHPQKAEQIYHRMVKDCQQDLQQLDRIRKLLATEFIKDHKRESVTQKVREILQQGHKVILISTFSDTVIDYYRYMTKDSAISAKGIGIAIGSTKRYYQEGNERSLIYSPNQICRGGKIKSQLKRQELFRLFAPVATCKNKSDRPTLEEEINVLIGSETLSVGQNLQDADYLINIDLPWNPMTLEQRIGRIDRPKEHKAEKIYIYYANSENQLLRQASRLSKLHQKLVGDLAQKNGGIPSISDTESLGASIYGDTLFDDEVLPGYIDFLNSLVKARRLEQNSLQENLYQKQETSRDLYTQNEILHGAEMSQLIRTLGDDYQANPIALGRRTGEANEPTGLIGLTVEYFGPNGESIPDKKQVVFWNDRTGERDSYGVAIATGFKTPEAGDVFSTKYLLACANHLYDKLVIFKKQRTSELKKPDTLENITVASERISKIQRRLSGCYRFPDGINRAIIKQTFQTLNTWRENKKVQTLLRNYTDGAKSQLEDAEFIVQLVQDTNDLSLIAFNAIAPTSLKITLSALLIRA